MEDVVLYNINSDSTIRYGIPTFNDRCSGINSLLQTIVLMLFDKEYSAIPYMVKSVISKVAISNAVLIAINNIRSKLIDEQSKKQDISEDEQLKRIDLKEILYYTDTVKINIEIETMSGQTMGVIV